MILTIITFISQLVSNYILRKYICAKLIKFVKRKELFLC